MRRLMCNHLVSGINFLMDGWKIIIPLSSHGYSNLRNFSVEQLSFRTFQISSLDLHCITSFKLITVHVLRILCIQATISSSLHLFMNLAMYILTMSSSLTFICFIQLMFDLKSSLFIDKFRILWYHILAPIMSVTDDQDLILTLSNPLPQVVLKILYLISVTLASVVYVSS